MNDKKTKKNKPKSSFAESLYDIVEQFSVVCAVVLVVFAFVLRLSIVDGTSMVQTLQHGENLVVSGLFYEPKAGDIVVIHDPTATPYDLPIVKRVIATGGQTVNIDYDANKLYVDGVEIDESSYKYLNSNVWKKSIGSINFPITVPEGEIFVLGDNRTPGGSADSRLPEIGTIDTRCVVGKAVARIFPIGSFTIFENPYND